ncbi:sulfotransferase family 2 domain-containing protein [Maritimibacter sp. DP1N21-5]|uniref:sulfotransferase family 2 domain-containing protein n=1 Tax=Maritimibacter sp. DP1N21-5 TaxID=2836867 RepID=UPI001C4497AB|nr:sulfotransferase family 2 domain-containing protein [Maritimibacter sp. DP1N21-5]MBV7410315.1 sulfotransferase family protein [Maritimibacter sp. DP1N21-5]
MPIFRISGKTILFLHIPKAGGTSVEEFLAQHSGESFRMTLNTERLPCVPQHFHGEMIEKLFAPDFFDYAFSVTRNPYARILSEYNYRMQHRHKPYRWFPVPSFETWLKTTLGRYRRDPYVYSNHIRPQIAFRIAGSRSFRLEDQIGNLMSELAEETGVDAPPALPHANRSTKRATAMTEAAAQLIQDFYAMDFETFGYSRDSFRDL